MEPNGWINKVHQGHALEILKQMPDELVDCIVTSPPYWGLRDYGTEPQLWGDGWKGSLGQEPTPDQYVRHLVEVFHEARRVLKKEGTLWLNLGDSYAGGRTGSRYGTSTSAFKPSLKAALHLEQNFVKKKPPGLKGKDLVGIPWMTAFALRSDGWYLRSEVIWCKPNATPESCMDRPTKSHEHLFLLSKSAKYFFDMPAVSEPAKTGGRVSKPTGKENSNDPTYLRTQNRALSRMYKRPILKHIRDVWTINTTPHKGAHFATFPDKLVVPCVRAGCRRGGVVMDTFMGRGTTGKVATLMGRRFVGIELSEEYVELSRRVIESAMGFMKSQPTSQPTSQKKPK